jgi:fused signal recognition particle receptor
MSFDELQKQMEQPAAPAAPPADEPSPWDEGPAFGGETRAFPRMSFDDLQKMPPESEPEPAAPEASPWEEPAPVAETAAPEPSIWDEQPAPEPEAPMFDSPFAAPEAEAEPIAEPEPELEPEPEPEPQYEPMMAAEPAPIVNSQITDDIAPSMAAGGLDLTDDQIERIAKRVVQMMSEQVVRNIAWEVIPDMAEMVVKERIKQLEAE